MTTLQYEFLSIISDYLHGEYHSYEISDELVKYAEMHELQAIFYKQIASPKLQNSYAQTIYYYKNRMNLIRKIDSILSEYEYFIVKGTEIAAYYPMPALRSMGDTDIVVHIKDKKAVYEHLKEFGFVFGDISGSSEWHFSKDNINFELHHALLYGSEATNKYVKFFESCFDYVQGKSLEPNYHMVYLLAHLRKHILQNGVGFRQFIDLAVFIKAVNDWSQVGFWLNEIDLSDFAGVVMELVYRWWNIECPLKKAISDDFFEEATQSIFSNGIFGYQDKNLRMNTFVQPNETGTISIIKKVFPPTTVLLHYAGYEFLNNHKWLYPYAVIKHIVHYYKRKYEYRKKYKDFIPDKDYIRGRKEYLRQWGL